MIEKDSLHGLNCPQCSGMIPIPEGQMIVRCPFCEQRSFVRGARGLRRYQVPQRIDQEQALAAWYTFLKGHFDIDNAAIEGAELTESFVVYLPFWAVWAKVLGWAFGEKFIGTKKYEPREIKITQEAHWNGVACDIGEFGVSSLELANQPLEPFTPAELHAQGMVFEPMNSQSEALASAEVAFEAIVTNNARSNIDQKAQVFTWLTHRRFGLVYYPLWVLRYVFKGRAFQIAVDGHNGEVLYGKAPGSTIYRAFALVSGMIFGMILAVDLAVFLFFLGLEMQGYCFAGGLVAAIALISVGFSTMFSAYTKFRYGEIFEYHAPRD